jgi:hypothetical protein
MVESRTLVNWRLYLFGAGVALLGLSVHLFLPLRALCASGDRGGDL